MKPSAFATSTAMAMAAVALASAVLAGVLVTVLSRPTDFTDRLAVLTSRTELAERMTQRNRGGAEEPLGTCAAGPAAQIQALKDEIAASATRLSLQSGPVEARVADLTEKGVTPIGLKLEVSGSYQSAMSLLDTLSARRPILFVDTIDLVSKTSNVTLSLQGRVFCVAS
jgi:hypothetical protein